jgi:hypothetical protein
MQVINTFMHGDRVLRPGDAIPTNVSDGELLAWKSSGLIGENYNGPTRRSQPGPTETKPAAPARKAATPKVPKPAADPKPAETKDASKDEASSAEAQTSSDVKDAKTQQHQAQSATEDVAAASAASDAKTE